MLRLLRSTRPLPSRVTLCARYSVDAAPPKAASEETVAEAKPAPPARQATPVNDALLAVLLPERNVRKSIPPTDYKPLGLKYDPAQLPDTRPLDPANKTYTEEQYAMTLEHGRAVHLPHFHSKTHGVPVANIHFRSHHTQLLDLFTHFATHAASALGIPTSKAIPLPTQRSLWTVLRSPFAHKKSQENFERKVHKRVIKAWDADPEVVQRWAAYLRKHAMPGVGMKVTTWERLPLGVGNAQLVQISEKDGSVVPKIESSKAEKIEAA